MFELIFFFFYRLGRVLRARIMRLMGQPAFSRQGRWNKIFGWKSIRVGSGVTIGDSCWIQAVSRYQSQKFSPNILIGDGVHLSDAVHISAVNSIKIGDGCLLGSRIYIGDHAHGDSSDVLHSSVPPGRRPLARIGEISIGNNCWICDGVVVLAGTNLAPGCVVAANSVVKLTTEAACLIAGSPAKIIKYF